MRTLQETDSFRAYFESEKEGQGLASSEKDHVQKSIMLSYFNRYLRERRVINEQEYLRLSSMINSKYPISVPKK